VQLARARLRRDIEIDRADNRDSKPVEKQALATPATRRRPSEPQSKPSECFPVAAFIRTVRVKLPCGVEQLFHVYPANAPHALGRKVNSLQRHLLLHPDNSKKRLELAELFHLAGDWHRASEQWQDALMLKPDLPAALKLGDTLLKLGETKAAADVFRNARRGDFQSAAALRHLDGWIAFCQKDVVRAAMDFQAAAELEPVNPVHWHALALARRLAGNVTAALAALQRALKLNENDLVALSIGHEMLLAAGEIEEAVRRAERLLQLAPLDLLTLRRLVDCRCQLKLIRGIAGLETIRLLRRTQRLSQNSYLIHETLASFFLEQGKPQKALAVHREFTEAHPQCVHSRKNYSSLQAATDGRDRQPEQLRVWKLPVVKGCNGACQLHEKSGRLHV
jgi:tetratricopeptide (TPR) repeat protein